MRAKAKICAVVVTASLACLFMLLPTASGAGSITLTPTAQAPGASVSVSGTGFGATRNVGIAFGSEIEVFSEPLFPVSTGEITRAYNWSRAPLKPGSMHIHLVSITYPGQQYDYYDDGTGRLLRNTDGALLGVVDYALGTFARNATGTPTENEWTATYRYYQYNVTSVNIATVTTTASGTFSAYFTVPAVTNGNYNVTAIDSGGTFATATLNVNNAVPEILPFGAVLLLSSVAVVAGSWHFRKRPRTTK